MCIYTVIVTYNATDWIRKCLDTLLSSSRLTNILIVDNCSSDNTLEIVRNDYPMVLIIENDINLGFGQANNKGLDRALLFNPRYVFLINQDAWVKPDTLENLICAAEKDKNFGIVSPVQLNGYGDALDYNFKYHIKKTQPQIESYEELKDNVNKTMEFNFVNAAMWLVSVACLKKTGRFDDIFFHYGEDNDYANRVNFHGYKIGVCCEAIGYHGREQTEYNFDNLDYKKRFHRRKIPYLINLMNINNPFIKNLKQSSGLAFKEIINHLKRGKLNFVIIELLSFGSVVLVDLSSIVKRRRYNKISYATPVF